LLELARNEQLWDQRPDRRLYPGTPHSAMTDITVRYMPEEQLTDLEVRRREHRNVFWPAWHALPALRPVVFGMMTRVQAVELGSILITRLPPGKQIEPHSDAGNWAPLYYNCKCHWTVAGSAVVTCDTEQCTFNAGTIWTFDNLLVHSIANQGECDRIVVIVSMRCE
jgi:mannose-6-phosphate isomerase-like protein (cupin superfamily)